MADDQRAPQWGDESAAITKQELVSTAAGVFVIGCIVGWALFGKPGQFRTLVLNNGSLADWLAAIGTWAIGFGALKFARDSNRYHVRMENERKAALLRNVAEKARKISVLKIILDKQSKRPDEELTKQALLYLLTQARETYESMVLTGEERNVIDEDRISAVHLIELNYRFFKDNAHHLSEDWYEDRAFDKHLRGWLNMCVQNASTAAGHADNLREFALDEIIRLSRA